MHRADIHHPSLSLAEKLACLYGLNRDKTVDLGFREPFISLLEAFGNPHLNLPPAIHVAGTNGKGSTIAVMRSILEARGKSVHTYTSPHLQRFNERIRLAGREITDEELEPLIDEALGLNGGNAATFFEITTAMAFAAFARTPADVLLLETGLGGRLDCTNVIKTPLTSVITAVSYDHTEFLGNTIEDIAREKAGIIKPGVPVVLGYQACEKDAIFRVVSEKAAASGSPLYSAGADWLCEPAGDTMRFVFGEAEMELPRPSLDGEHQLRNAGTALAALKVAGMLPAEDAVTAKALREVYWPGRLELLRESGPLDDVIPPGWEVYVDGGHNGDAGQALASRINKWKSETPTAPVYVIAGMLGRKDPAPFLEALVPAADAVYAAGIPSARDESLAPGELKKIAPGSIKTLEGGSVRDFLKSFFATGPKPGRLLICGSLYLAGDVLQGYLRQAV